jgi:transcriptional regulator GlxA family with amidase domain
MKQACYLLEHSNLSITAIANSVGFDNGLYFSKTFHKKKGTSPKAYRIKIQPIIKSDGICNGGDRKI